MRVWIASALFAAAGVLTALYVFDRPPERPEVPAQVPPPPALQETEVRLYIAIITVRDEIMAEYLSVHRPGVDAEKDKAIGVAIQTRMEQECRSHHITAGEFDFIRRRVEYIVDVVRRDDAAPERAARREQKLEDLRGQLEHTGDEILRKKLQEQIDYEEALKSAPEPRAYAGDKELVRRFWDDLDRLAPRRR